MHYLHNLLSPGMKILDIGAGTGVYSHTLANEGYEVDAIDLVPRNVKVIKKSITAKEKRFAQDGLSHIIREAVNSMSDESYAVWLQYLIASAEKEELMGYSNHVIQILTKKRP